MADRKTGFSALMAEEIIFLVNVKASVPNKNKETKNAKKQRNLLGASRSVYMSLSFMCTLTFCKKK